VIHWAWLILAHTIGLVCGFVIGAVLSAAAQADRRRGTGE